MTRTLFRDDAYLRQADATVLDIDHDGGLIVDASVFYPTGGGQPGDCGDIFWDGKTAEVVSTRKGEGDDIKLMLADGSPIPDPGTDIRQVIDWKSRLSYMRVHTALHLLSVVIPLPVTGGSISVGKGRLDFDMETPPEDKEALAEALNALIARDLAVTEDWITEADLDANPGLVKTMSVQPPRGAGKIRLVRIGTETEQVDLQPCGGTHVARTGEIGRVRLGKVEKKGAQNRRVYLHLED